MTASRIYGALPSVLLGTLFNLLDAVSTGLLIFPSNGNAFKTLQIQGMSMYIMSSILSQVAMTLGGSLFPGALGAMLIEILPFLRGIACDIQSALGDENPALVPTVMVAYAFTSFLIGIVFTGLGVLKAGVLVSYFPGTVLTGMIGGIGVSLFTLGLGIPFPASAPALTLASTKHVLFGTDHLPLLFASCVPAFLLSITTRSEFLHRWTRDSTSNPFYVPIFFILIPVLFWIGVAGLHRTNSVGMATLIQRGWLFKIDNSSGRDHGLGTSWIYWNLFDFSKVEFSALRSAITNIVLVVVIGVLNLPIYVPALGLLLDVPVNMNHEFIGHGVANILAGVAGTVPNILQLSYSAFFTRAQGGRIEASIVIFFTFGFFLCSSLVLPYVPTVLASTLVLFLGIELTLEAVWESMKTLVYTEWLVVMTTLLACTFIGYAPGFGVGLAAAAVMYLLCGIADTKARVVESEPYEDLHDSPPAQFSKTMQIQRKIGCDWEHELTSLQKQSADIESQQAPGTQESHQESAVDVLSRIRTISLCGYVFFAAIPSLEAQLSLKNERSVLHHFIIIDFTRVCRVETSAVQLLEKKARENPETVTIVFCGIPVGSGTCADIQRGGINLNFSSPRAAQSQVQTQKGIILTFKTRGEATEWCKSQVKSDVASQSSISISSNNEYSQILDKSHTFTAYCKVESTVADEDAIRAFSKLPGMGEIFRSLFPSLVLGDLRNLSDSIAQFKALGGRFQMYEPGQVVMQNDDTDSRLIVILQGSVVCQNLRLKLAGNKLRLALGKALIVLLHKAYVALLRRQGLQNASSPSDTVFSRTLGIRESFELVVESWPREGNTAAGANWDQVKVLSDCKCWTVEVCKDRSIGSLRSVLESWKPDLALTLANSRYVADV